MTGSEVKAMKDTEIATELKRLRMRLFDLRAQVVTGKVENTSEFRAVRRDIARLLTEQRSRRPISGRVKKQKVAAPAKVRGGNKGVKKGAGASKSNKKKSTASAKA